jgi:hypothetical protein
MSYKIGQQRWQQLSINAKFSGLSKTMQAKAMFGSFEKSLNDPTLATKKY